MHDQLHRIDGGRAHTSEPSGRSSTSVYSPDRAPVSVTRPPLSVVRYESAGAGSVSSATPTVSNTTFQKWASSKLPACFWLRASKS